MAELKEPQLPTELQGKVELVGLKPGKYFMKGKEYNFTTMKLEQALALAKDPKFPYLQEVKPKETTEKTEKKS